MNEQDCHPQNEGGQCGVAGMIASGLVPLSSLSDERDQFSSLEHAPHVNIIFKYINFPIYWHVRQNKVESALLYATGGDCCQGDYLQSMGVHKYFGSQRTLIMDKLKVYLEKQNRDNKSTIDKIKHKMLHSRSEIVDIPSHQPSHLNLRLTASTKYQHSHQQTSVDKSVPAFRNYSSSLNKKGSRNRSNSNQHISGFQIQTKTPHHSHSSDRVLDLNPQKRYSNHRGKKQQSGRGNMKRNWKKGQVEGQPKATKYHSGKREPSNPKSQNYSNSICKIITTYKSQQSHSQFQQFLKKIRTKQSKEENNKQAALKPHIHAQSRTGIKLEGLAESQIGHSVRSHHALSKSSVEEKPIVVVGKKRSKSAKEGKKGLQEKNTRQIYTSNKMHQSSERRVNSGRRKINSLSQAKTKKIEEHEKAKVEQEAESKIVTEMSAMFRTRKGVQISNPNKVNQDRFVIMENCRIDSHRKVDLYAVADGHGPLGHFVSHSIAENLPIKVQHYLRNGKKPIATFQKTYSDLQNILEKNVEFNAEYSGSTLVSIIVENKKKITCANVGDSRAIVARQINKHNWEVVRLSDDHKPNRDSEKKRIIGCGGRIEKVKDEDGIPIGPWRVWLPRKQLQGLAMSRSLGDNISKPIGVTHEPEILNHQLDSRDKFILIASDGVWEFLTNYQILTLIIPFYRNNQQEEACNALLKAAYQSWTVDDNTVVDDITFILIFLTSKVADKRQEQELQSSEQSFNDIELDSEPIEKKEQALNRE